MVSKFQHRQTEWVKFLHSVTGAQISASLEMHAQNFCVNASTCCDPRFGVADIYKNHSEFTVT